MNRPYLLAKPMPWAAVLLAAAAPAPPHVLAVIVLVLLAMLSMCVVGHGMCLNWSGLP